MANITQLYRTPPHGGDDMDEYKKKLFRHRAGLGAKGLIGLAVVLVIVLAVWFWFRNKTYTDYEVVSSTEHSSTVNTQYAEYQGGHLLRYSRDGISCIDSKNNAVWSQTYIMQYPILDICGSAVVAADQQGNEAYVFNSKGLLTQITTLLPIQQVSISSQGVTALLLNDGDVSWIYLYDTEGNVLAESRCSLDETGQPLSISISPDGTKLAVSYLQIQEGTACSCIVFYNFGSVGANFVDKIVSSKVYADTLIPRVEYLSSSVCAAVSDQGIIYYEGDEIPEETLAVEIHAEILSVFFGTDRVGIITEDPQNPEETDAEETGQKADSGQTEETAAEESGASGGAADDAGASDGAADDNGAADSSDETAAENGEAAAEDSKDAESQAAEEPEKTDDAEKSGRKEETEEETGRYQVNIYDTKGRVLLSERTDLLYTQAKLSKNMLILYNDTECEIYSEQGILKYAGTFDTAISDIYKGSGFRRYIVVFSDRTDTIKLK